MAREAVTMTPTANQELSPSLQRVKDAQTAVEALQAHLEAALDIRAAQVRKALHTSSQRNVAQVLGVSHTAVQNIAQRGQQ